MAIAYKHLSDRVPAPSGFADDIPPDLDGFVESATDPSRELRPESAREMRTDLGSIASHLPRARSLGALVQDLPEVVLDGEPTEAVVAAVTDTIPGSNAGSGAGGSASSATSSSSPSSRQRRGAPGPTRSRTRAPSRRSEGSRWKRPSGH